MLVVSFHSYKGGSCRSSTCINTLPFLVEQLGADAEHPILVIDTDIDSQGLTYLFGAEKAFDVYDSKMLLSGKIPGKNKQMPVSSHDFFKYCATVGDKIGVEVDKSVYFLGVNDQKVFAVQDMNGRADMALADLYIMCKNLGVKAIVFDTASGDQFSATATIKSSSVMVCCMRPTQQFRVGTSRFLSRFKTSIKNELHNTQNTRVIVLPTAVPRNSTVIAGGEQREIALERIIDSVQGVGYEVCREFLKGDCFGIPEVERFKWQEDVLYLLNCDGRIDDESDAQLALSRYELLAKNIIAEDKKING